MTNKVNNDSTNYINAMNKTLLSENKNLIAKNERL